MTKQEKEKIIGMLDKAVAAYFMFRNRDDYPDKPCVRAEAATRQSAVFSLSHYLHEYKFITWEQCCEYWAKVEIIEGIENEKCQFTYCGANINGVCKYTINKNRESGNNELPEMQQ